MTKEEAYNILLKLRAWRAWGHSEQNGTDRPELPSQKEIDQALDIFIEVLSQHSLSEGLEEAAEKYNKQVIEKTKCHHNALTYAEGYEDALLLIPDTFKAGAEWQYQKDRGEFAKIEAKTWCEGFNEGFDACKKKMMEKAMETQILTTSFINLPKEYLHQNGIQADDKVRVIVIKEDEK